MSYRGLLRREATWLWTLSNVGVRPKPGGANCRPAPACPQTESHRILLRANAPAEASRRICRPPLRSAATPPPPNRVKVYSFLALAQESSMLSCWRRYTCRRPLRPGRLARSEEHTSELQSLR